MLSRKTRLSSTVEQLSTPLWRAPLKKEQAASPGTIIQTEEPPFAIPIFPLHLGSPCCRLPCAPRACPDFTCLPGLIIQPCLVVCRIAEHNIPANLVTGGWEARDRKTPVLLQHLPELTREGTGILNKGSPISFCKSHRVTIWGFTHHTVCPNTPF